MSFFSFRLLRCVGLLACPLGLSLAVLSSGGCASRPADAAQTVDPHTLGGNPKLPFERMRELYKGRQEAFVRDLPYSAYVIMRGGIAPQYDVTIREIVESYPDDTRNDQAKALVQDVTLVPIAFASRVQPAAEVFVIFYDNNDGSGSALVFAHPKEAISFERDPRLIPRSERSHYLEVFDYDAPAPSADE